MLRQLPAQSAVVAALFKRDLHVMARTYNSGVGPGDVELGVSQPNPYKISPEKLNLLNEVCCFRPLVLIHAM